MISSLVTSVSVEEGGGKLASFQSLRQRTGRFPGFSGKYLLTIALHLELRGGFIHKAIRWVNSHARTIPTDTSWFMSGGRKETLWVSKSLSLCLMLVVRGRGACS